MHFYALLFILEAKTHQKKTEVQLLHSSADGALGKNLMDMILFIYSCYFSVGGGESIA